MKIEIGKRLKRLRMEKGFTQKELASKVSGGLDYTYIGKIERGEQLPSLKILAKISEALSVPVAYFFRDETITMGEFYPPTLSDLAEDEKGRELLKALKLLHKDDIPLMIEIVRVLSRHRNPAGRRLYKTPDEEFLQAAEKEPVYRKK